MGTALYIVSPSGLPGSSDVNQLVGGVDGTLDMGDWQLGPPIATPNVAPTAAVNSTPGNLNGSYAYVYTFVTGQVDSYGTLHVAHETGISPVSNTITPADQQGTITGIATDTSTTVVGRRLYRNQASGSPSGPYYLVATIPDNTTTQYADNVADSNLGAEAPTTNTTGGTLTGQFRTQPTPLGREYGMIFQAQGTATSSANYYSTSLAFQNSTWNGSAAVTDVAMMQMNATGSLVITAPQGIIIAGYSQVVLAPTSGQVHVVQDFFGDLSRVYMQFNDFVNDSGSTYYLSWANQLYHSLVGFNGTGTDLYIGGKNFAGNSWGSWIGGANSVAIGSSTTAVNGVVYFIGR